MAKCCDQCLFSKNKLVSHSRRRQILDKCSRTGRTFECHKATIAGKQVMCHAFFRLQLLVGNMLCQVRNGSGWSSTSRKNSYTCEMVLNPGDSIALKLSANSTMDVLVLYEDVLTESNPRNNPVPGSVVCTINTGVNTVIGSGPAGTIRRVTSIMARNNGGASQDVSFVFNRNGQSFQFSPTSTVASGKGLVAGADTSVSISVS